MDASGVSRDIPPAGTPVADVLANINPGMQPAADPAAEPPPTAHVSRSRVPSLGSRAVSHIWTVDSFDESAGVPADRTTWGGGASMHHSREVRAQRGTTVSVLSCSAAPPHAPLWFMFPHLLLPQHQFQLIRCPMQDVRRVVGTSPPRPDSPSSPTIPPPVARDAPNPGPLQRPLTRSRSSLAHAPAVPFAPSRVASPQFPNTSVPGGLVVAMHEPRMVPIPRGLPGGPASAAMRECEVFGVSPSGYATLRAGHASGWIGAAAQDARMQALERLSASGSLYQEAVRDPFHWHCGAQEALPFVRFVADTQTNPHASLSLPISSPIMLKQHKARVTQHKRTVGCLCIAQSARCREAMMERT